jgi:protein-tyrosine kinase
MSDDLPRGGSLAERVASRLGNGRNVADMEPVAAAVTPPPPEAPVALARASAPPTPSQDAPLLEINFSKLQAAGFITPDSLRTPNTEAIRGIKRQLLKTAFPQGHKGVSGTNNHDNVIMVTSSMPGEGKTFVSLNLAMSFCAERDLSVLLIDGDGHRRFLGGLLGATEGVGIVDILVDKTLQVGDLIQRTSIPNLSFLSGGHSHPHSAELLASKQFGQLMQDLAAHYPNRIIIIDTPPVLASTEAVVLSGYVGQTVVVVEKDRTSKRQLQRTLEMLDGARNVGCVLNFVPAEEDFTGYGY